MNTKSKALSRSLLALEESFPTLILPSPHSNQSLFSYLEVPRISHSEHHCSIDPLQPPQNSHRADEASQRRSGVPHPKEYHREVGRGK